MVNVAHEAYAVYEAQNVADRLQHQWLDHWKEKITGLGKIVIAGPMGVMSGKAYLQTMENLDRQGAE